jgi:hypothetical protein
MSLRLFVYYCMICGAWAGFVGWALGVLIVSTTITGDGSVLWRIILSDTLKGSILGQAIAIGLSFLDALFNLPPRQPLKVVLRVWVASMVGSLAGLIGSLLGSSVYNGVQAIPVVNTISPVFLIVGWTVVGFLIGASICFFEILGSVLTGKNLRGAIRKCVKCTLGGTVGGILGGTIALALIFLARLIFANKDTDKLWSPTAIGFVALGACIGLLVGLAQMLLKEAWIRVEAGFRPGREMILTKEKTSIGRAEGSDIALFGDSGVEKAHAFIVLEGGRYYLEDQGTPGGSYINDQKVEGRAPLKAGDLIRVGKSVLRFNERVKRKN